jgi:uncharacterized protein (TIGR02145 family)
MRHPHLPALLLLLAACGGSTPDPTTPPPPPPGGTVPATLAVAAGAGQTAEPGAKVPVRPSVAVKDAAGRAVAGVTVTFTVDSGGGAVQSGSATTDAMGMADPGDWTLGSGEGRNVMSATVASLPKVKFVATSSVPTVVVKEATLVSGTINVTSGPLAGTQLSLPVGAFPSATRWTLEQRTGTGWTLRSGVTPVGATLHLTSSADGIPPVALPLTLPAPERPGFQRFILMQNPASGEVEVLPTISSTATTVTGLAPHFFGNAPGFDVAATARTSRTMRMLGNNGAGGYDALVVVADIPQADLDKDMDTGFRPGVDDWEFPNIATEPVAPLASGRLLSAAVHFAYRKQQNGALWGKYQEAPPLGTSNRIGIRVSAHYELARAGTDYDLQMLATRNALPAGTRDAVFYSYLKASMFVTQLPQILLSHSLTDKAFEVFLAYRVSGGRVYVASSSDHGNAGISTQYTAAGFSQLTGSSSLPNFPDIGTASLGLGFDTRKALTTFEHYVSNTFPANDPPPFPAYEVRVHNGFTQADTAFLLENARVWFSCPGCKYPQTTSFESSPIVVPSALFQSSGGQWVSSGSGPGWNFGPTWSPSSRRVGFLIVDLDPNSSDQLWVDWRFVWLKKWHLDITGPATVGAGAATTFSVAVTGPDAAPSTFVWTFGTGSTAMSVTTTTPTATVTLTGQGVQDITVEMQRLSDSKVLARGTGSIEVKDCPDNITDSRDGEVYAVVCIGTQKWLQENLRFNASGSRCYGDVPGNCALYGRMYSWNTVMSGAAASALNPSGVRGVCPAGWHVPSMAEWNQLIALFGGVNLAGAALKSVTGWNQPNPATNASGFSLLPGGFFVNGGFASIGDLTYLWSTTAAPPGNPGYYSTITVSHGVNWASPTILEPVGMASLRCLKD